MSEPEFRTVARLLELAEPDPDETNPTNLYGWVSVFENELVRLQERVELVRELHQRARMEAYSRLRDA